MAMQRDQIETDATVIPSSTADLRRLQEEQRAWLASPPLSDDELAVLRRQYPEQAWAYTRDIQDGLRKALRERAEGHHGQIYLSPEEFLSALK